SRRVYIPKTDGRQRPLGTAALEDKIVQQAVVTILNEIYEVDFRGFSYGFRPGRSPHQALDALTVGIQRKRVNWVLDADIRGFLDNLSHAWTMKFIEHRVADRRILRLIRKWLKAGVSEDGQWSETKLGTPQGAVASPLIANVYLHYEIRCIGWGRMIGDDCGLAIAKVCSTLIAAGLCRSLVSQAELYSVSPGMDAGMFGSATSSKAFSIRRQRVRFSLSLGPDSDTTTR